MILGADQKERSLWGRRCILHWVPRLHFNVFLVTENAKHDPDTDWYAWLKKKDAFGGGELWDEP